MIVARTARLALRELALADAPFIVALLNDRDWLRNIGDKHVHSEAAAREYIAAGPRTMYARHGFGLWVAERSADAVPMGLCGLIRRPSLDDVDIGFAFLPAYRGHGYAREGAAAALDLARGRFELTRVVGIVTPANAASVRLLEKLGLRYERDVPADSGEVLALYGLDL